MIRVEDVLGDARHPRGAADRRDDGAVRSDRRLLDQTPREHGVEDARVPEVLLQGNWPRAWSVAIFALVPVPQGERSIVPVHVAGRIPVELSCGNDNDVLSVRLRARRWT